VLTDLDPSLARLLVIWLRCDSLLLVPRDLSSETLPLAFNCVDAFPLLLASLLASLLADGAAGDLAPVSLELLPSWDCPRDPALLGALEALDSVCGDGPVLLLDLSERDGPFSLDARPVCSTCAALVTACSLSSSTLVCAAGDGLASCGPSCALDLALLASVTLVSSLITLASPCC